MSRSCSRSLFRVCGDTFAIVEASSKRVVEPPSVDVEAYILSIWIARRVVEQMISRGGWRVPATTSRGCVVGIRRRLYTATLLGTFARVLGTFEIVDSRVCWLTDV